MLNNNSQEIRFRDGDHLIVTLKHDGDRVVFERSLFGEEVLKRKPVEDREALRATREDWSTSLLRNGIKLNEELLSQLVAVEDRINKRVRERQGLLQWDLLRQHRR